MNFKLSVKEVWQKYKENSWVYFIFGGFITGLAFVLSGFGWLVVPGIFLFLKALAYTKKLRDVILGSWLFGTLHFGLALMWWWSVYPISPIKIDDGLAQLYIIGIYWLSAAVVIGAGTIIVGLVAYQFQNNSVYGKSGLVHFIFPTVWVASEMLGSFLFSIGTLGPGSILNTSFSFGYVGYGFATYNIFLPVAQIGGVYSLSWFVVFVSYSIYRFWSIDSKKMFWYTYGAIVFSIVSLVLLSYYMVVDVGVVHKKIVTINSRFDSNFVNQSDGYKKERVSALKAVERALRAQPDIILLPEGLQFTHNFDSAETALAFIQKQKKANVLLVDSARVEYENDNVVLRAYMYDTNRNTTYIVDKSYLVAQGEYIPYGIHAILKLLAPQDVLYKLERRLRYVPSNKNSNQDVPENIPGIIFCSESVVPTSVRDAITTKSVPFVLHPFSHGWFHESTILWRQLDTMLMTQSVWNGVSIISAGNLAKGSLFMPNGKQDRGVVIDSSEFWDIVEYEL